MRGIANEDRQRAESAQETSRSVQPQLASLLAQARNLFEESTGHSARFFEPVVIKEGHRTRVVRCGLESTTAGVNSIMIKEI